MFSRQISANISKILVKMGIGHLFGKLENTFEHTFDLIVHKHYANTYYAFASIGFYLRKWGRK